jgi:hypothetical protein
MRVNKWTLGLAAVGLVSLPAGLLADEATKMNQVWTALSSTTISGYVDTSAQWNFGTGNANQAGYAYGPGKADGFNLDAVKVSIAKPLDEAQWAAGYQVDLVYGPNAQTLGTSGSGSEFAIQQAYVALRTPVGNGLDVKIGVFNAIIGYESFDAGKNPNWTRSYGYTIEPTTQEGVLASYQFAEWLTAQAGVANTFGPAIGSRAYPPGGNRAESYKTYMGSLALTAPKDMGWLEGSTLYLGCINGFNSSQSGFTDTHLYAGATLNTPVKDVKVGAAFDYVFGGNYAAAPSGFTTDQWNIAGYVSFRMTEKMSLHGRVEYYSRSGEFQPNGDEGWTLPSKAFELTGTLQYDLWKNVISRLEFRWDHAANGQDAFGGEYPPVGTGDPVLKNQYILAANFIYQF